MITGFGNSAQGCPSISLALWADAWLRGAASPDDVIDGLASWAELHLLSAHSEPVAVAAGISWPGAQDTGAVALLGLLRRLPQPATLHVLLPAPGDTSGLTPGSAHATAAIAAGETLIISSTLGLVPIREGRDVLRWAVFGLDGGDVPQPPGLGEARYALREAVRDAAELFGRLQTVGASPTAARARIAELTEDAHSHQLPGTTGPRVAEVLDSAATIAAILTVAGEAAGGDPTSASASAMAEQTIHRLWGVVRTARLAAVHEAVRHMTEHGSDLRGGH